MGERADRQQRQGCEEERSRGCETVGEVGEPDHGPKSLLIARTSSARGSIIASANINVEGVAPAERTGRYIVPRSANAALKWCNAPNFFPSHGTDRKTGTGRPAVGWPTFKTGERTDGRRGRSG